MTLKLRIVLLIFSLIVIIATTYVLRKGRIPVKYSLLWYFAGGIILILSLFPLILEFASNILGFKTISNLIIGIIISLLLFLTMSLTIITSGQKKKITLLLQEISIMKKRLDDERK